MRKQGRPVPRVSELPGDLRLICPGAAVSAAGHERVVKGVAQLAVLPALPVITVTTGPAW